MSPGLANARRSLLLTLAISQFALSVASAQSPPGAVSGCYGVTLGTWAPAVGLGADTVETIPPSRIELLTDIVTTALGRGSWIIRPAPGASPGYYRFSSFYRPAPADSIDLVWSTGFSGVQMRVARSNDNLVGWATTFWDFERTTQRASVRLVRESCGADAYPGFRESIRDPGASVTPAVRAARPRQRP